MTERAGQDLTVLVRHRRAQFQVGDCLAELALQGAQDATGHQQPGPFRRRPGEPEQDLGQPVLPLPQQAGDLPVGAQVGGQPGRFPGAAGLPAVRRRGGQHGLHRPAGTRHARLPVGVARRNQRCRARRVADLRGTAAGRRGLRHPLVIRYVLEVCESVEEASSEPSAWRNCSPRARMPPGSWRPACAGRCMPPVSMRVSGPCTPPSTGPPKAWRATTCRIAPGNIPWITFSPAASRFSSARRSDFPEHLPQHGIFRHRPSIRRSRR